MKGGRIGLIVYVLSLANLAFAQAQDRDLNLPYNAYSQGHDLPASTRPGPGHDGMLKRSTSPPIDNTKTEQADKSNSAHQPIPNTSDQEGDSRKPRDVAQTYPFTNVNQVPPVSRDKTPPFKSKEDSNPESSSNIQPPHHVPDEQWSSTTSITSKSPSPITGTHSPPPLPTSLPPAGIQQSSYPLVSEQSHPGAPSTVKSKDNLQSAPDAGTQTQSFVHPTSVTESPIEGHTNWSKPYSHTVSIFSSPTLFPPVANSSTMLLPLTSTSSSAPITTALPSPSPSPSPSLVATPTPTSTSTSISTPKTAWTSLLPSPSQSTELYSKVISSGVQSFDTNTVMPSSTTSEIQSFQSQYEAGAQSIMPTKTLVSSSLSSNLEELIPAQTSAAYISTTDALSRTTDSINYLRTDTSFHKLYTSAVITSENVSYLQFASSVSETGGTALGVTSSRDLETTATTASTFITVSRQQSPTTFSGFLPPSLVQAGVDPSNSADIGPQSVPIDQSLPKLISPAGGLPEPPQGKTLVQIGFKRSLNYPFVARNALASAQILAYMPVVVSTGLQLKLPEIVVQSLRPASQSGYIATLVLMYIPYDHVSLLERYVTDLSSPLYTLPTGVAHQLAAQINPDISIYPSIGMPNSGFDQSDPGKTNSHDSDLTSGSLDSPKTNGKVESMPYIFVGALGAVVVFSALVFVGARRRAVRRLQSRSDSSVSQNSNASATPSSFRGTYSRSSRTSRIGGRDISGPLMTQHSLGWKD